MARKLGILVLFLVAASVTALALMQDQLTGWTIRQRLQQKPVASYFEDRGHIRVLLCGTGSPEVSPARSQACTLVSAGGKLFLFDVGDGAVRSLTASNVPVNRLTRVFITHLHSDHFNDLGPLINAGWIWGRTVPLEVQGPIGIKSVIDGIAQSYALDERYRSDNMPHLAVNRAVARGAPLEIAFAEGRRSVRVYDESGVTIDATLVAHDPVRPALGYVLRYRGKKLFITGDGQVSPVNEPAMRNADMVIQEAYATHMVRQAIPQMRTLGMNFEAEVAERTIPYHADTIALARQAQAVGVKHLVLTHLIPWPDGFIARHLFVRGMSEHFDGEITLGSDGQLIIL